MTTSSLFGILTNIALVLVFVFATIAFVFTNRLLNRKNAPMSEEVGSIFAVLRKLRKRQPMSTDELTLARQVVSDRRSLMAYSIPAALFSIGCFYVFGSLDYAHLHGITPSERTFLGVIPMFTSTNLALRMIKSASLRRRLPKKVAPPPNTQPIARP
jgi:Kef-type K+ transport system membrane component KefB